jgi:DNA-binding response OmpR family regulator
MRILYLDDHPLQLEIAQQWLEADGHSFHGFQKGAEALKALQRDSFDLAVLDWMIPDVSGEEVLRHIRRTNLRLPVLFATSNDDEAEIVHILGLGADDYLVKPLRKGEFLARVRALARRSGKAEEEAESPIELAAYRLDPRSRTAFLGGKPVSMTPRMFAVALLAFRNPGELLSRARIYEEVWGHREALETRTVDTHMSRVRSALQLDGRHGLRLTSIYQHGYRLEPSQPA